MKIPYGIANFADVRSGGYFYVDKTPFLPVLEDLGPRSLLFLRPRRMGKSLLVSLLSHYYDLDRVEQFDALFRGLWIHEHPTPERGRYLVLTLDFSQVGVDGDDDTLRRSFLEAVRGPVEGLLLRYRDRIPALVDLHDALDPIDDAAALNGRLSNIVSGTGHKLYLLIDEYDNFANRLLSAGTEDVYTKLVERTGFVRVASMLKDEADLAIDTRDIEVALAAMALRGDIAPFLDLFHTRVLAAIGVKDLRRFDEKAIKLMMLAFISLSRLFYPLSEKEFAQGYCDLFLGVSPLYPAAKHAWLLELKYLPTGASAKQIEQAFKQAEEQVARYAGDQALVPLLTRGQALAAGSLVFVGTKKPLFRPWPPQPKKAARPRAKPGSSARRPSLTREPENRPNHRGLLPLRRTLPAPVLDGNALEPIEVFHVSRHEDQPLNLRDGSDLAVGKRRDLSQASEAPSLLGMPFGRSIVVRKNRHRRPDHIEEIVPNLLLALAWRHAMESEQRFVPRRGSNREPTGMETDFPHEPGVGLRLERLGQRVRVQQEAEAHHFTSRPGEGSRRPAKIGSTSSSARSCVFRNACSALQKSGRVRASRS